jgi:F-type H+-transporting ATPase subunit f
MTNVVKFYKGLPQGQAAPVKASGPFERYREKYFTTGSGRPLVHAIGFLLVFGYSLDYYFHLRHHEH